MKKRMAFTLGIITLLMLSTTMLAASSASANPGTLLHIDSITNQIHLNSTAKVKVTQVNAFAWFSNQLSMTSPNPQVALADCKVAGATNALGVITGGSDLMFSLLTPEGNTFITGTAGENSTASGSNYQHARLSSLSPTTVRMSWEDLYGGGDEDGDDCIVDVTVDLTPEIVKTRIAGPDEIGIHLPDSTQYVFEITYNGPAARVLDTVPSEFEVTELSATAGEYSFYSMGNGNGHKRATQIHWEPPAGYNILTVTIETRLSPGGGRNKKFDYSPTTCGPLSLNEGATAFENADGDGASDVIVGPSNALVVEAVAGTQPCES